MDAQSSEHEEEKKKRRCLRFCVCRQNSESFLPSFAFFLQPISFSRKTHTKTEMADEEFQQASSGASKTYPAQCSSLRKNGYVVIKGFACKIVDMSTSKTGKHGHAKVHLVGIDIFTGRKYEDLSPSTHNMDVPEVTRQEFTLVDITDDGFVSLMNSDGELKSDLKVPEGELGADLKAMFDDGKEVTCSVLGALGIEAIVSFKEGAAKCMKEGAFETSAHHEASTRDRSTSGSNIKTNLIIFLFSDWLCGVLAGNIRIGREEEQHKTEEAHRSTSPTFISVTYMNEENHPKISLSSSSQLPDSQSNDSESPQTQQLHAKYKQLCDKLVVSEPTRSKGWDILMEVPSDQQPQQWIPFALHVASRTEDKYTIALSSLLRIADIKIMDFFDKMKIFMSIVGLDGSHEEHLLLLKRKWIIMTCLYHKYEKIYSELLTIPSEMERKPHFAGEKSDQYHVYSFGWLLFLVVKARLLAGHNGIDFINSYHMLLCCVNFILVHAPKSHRRISLTDPSIIASNAASVAISREEDRQEQPIASPDGVNNLPYLCTIFKANNDELSEVQNRLFAPFLRLFGKNNILKFDVVQRDDILYFDNLLVGENLIRNKNQMNIEYDYIYYESGDIDERLFLDQVEHIGTPSKIQSAYYHRNNDQFSMGSPFRSSAPQESVQIPQTPVAAALDNVSWLHTTLSKTKVAPSAMLERYFAIASSEMSARVKDRVSGMTGKIEEKSMEGGRVTMGVKLYFKILEHMLTTEEARLNQNNFSTLLGHDVFHASLLACCLDIVACAYKMDGVQFPFFIRLFDLQPFDYLKIIENVIRNESEGDTLTKEQIPKGITRHLVHTEEMIVEQLGWEEGSSLYILLPKTPSQLVSLQNYIFSSSSNVSLRRDSISTLTSPTANKSQSIETKTPATPGKMSHTLDLFYRKAAHVALTRTKELCNRLKIPVQVYTQIWQAVVHALVQQSSLMKGRHMDQIIMSSIYAVCKVYGMQQITFRVIIDQYKVCPHHQGNSKIFREVLLADGQKRDIIAFYNTTYIPIMEKSLLDFPQITSTNGEEETPAPIQSPNSKLIVSPMKSRATITSPSHGRQTESTIRSVYSVGESPAKGLHMINARVNSPKSRPRKRLVFDSNDDTPTPHKFIVSAAEESYDNLLSIWLQHLQRDETARKRRPEEEREKENARGYTWDVWPCPSSLTHSRIPSSRCSSPKRRRQTLRSEQTSDAWLCRDVAQKHWRLHRTASDNSSTVFLRSRYVIFGLL
ncbi:hypothetical protein PROFUN_05976 [Planoprotostelium fungivorum]|uniref:Translation elongation factor IF5A C-terminal domain-containing protein n=1 Tax=Planoprotostelium fungivorum TaxID=1890364 RepID=A0A2P6NP98_9EUKA|nr:hypothetical protein PROFUN_05976 [Planoprotostelium fungivorum]